MNFDFQPVLTSGLVTAQPLMVSDFERLYAAASDPLIWEQHPNKLRYKRDVFETFFQGAIESASAFLVTDTKTGEVIGSSRYSNYDEAARKVAIGYTFFIRKCWGKGYNPALKKLMIDHAFQFVDTVVFYIGAVNKRSQISIQRIGAVKTGEEETAYYGESPKLDFIFSIEKNEWQKKGNNQLLPF